MCVARPNRRQCSRQLLQERGLGLARGYFTWGYSQQTNGRLERTRQMKQIPPTSAAGTPVPSRTPARIWLVIWPGGERSFIHREPIEGIVEWAKGTSASVIEYRFGAIVHKPSTPAPEATKVPLTIQARR